MSSISGLSGMGSAMPQAMTGASMRMPPQQKMSNLFQQIDTACTGSITKAQFTQAFNSANTPAAFKAIGVDAAFSKLDPSGTGGVSKKDFISGMKSLMTHGHQRHHKEAGGETTAVQTPQTLASSTVALNALGVAASGAVAGSLINLSA